MIARRPYPGASRYEREFLLERSFVLSLLPNGSVGAEIGVWKGDFAAELLRVVRPSRVHLIDPWAFEADDRYHEAWYGGASARGQEEMDSIYEGVRDRFAEPIADGVVVLERGRSADVGLQFTDGYFDWVYIDGNHLFEFVRRDLEIYSAKVRAGGYITGDDYDVPGWWEGGVTRAVDEFIASGAYEVVHLGTQFVLRKP